MFKTLFDKITGKIVGRIPFFRTVVEFLHYSCVLFPKYIILALVKRGFSLKRSKEEKTHKKRRYITYSPTNEGIGGIMVRYTAARIFADIFELEYVHKPFPVCFHYDCDFDAFLGFADDEMRYEDIQADSSVKELKLPEFNLKYNRRLKLFLLGVYIRQIHNENNVIFAVSGYSNAESHVVAPEAEVKLFKKHQTKYILKRITDPMESPFKEGKIKVAVQVRRSEINRLKEQKTHEGIARWRSNEWYISVINTVNQILGQNNVDIVIYSDAENLAEIQDIAEIGNCSVHLKKDDFSQPFRAFHAMTISDISICSVSGFSIESAKLSSGLKIVPTSSLGYDLIYNGPDWKHVSHGSELVSSDFERFK